MSHSNAGTDHTVLPRGGVEYYEFSANVSRIIGTIQPGEIFQFAGKSTVSGTHGDGDAARVVLKCRAIEVSVMLTHMRAFSLSGGFSPLRARALTRQ